MVIGLTGTNGAGKTTLADHLAERGFTYLSLSDELRRELEAQSQPATRENLILCGNRLRQQFGLAVLAERTAARILADRNYVVDSIRHPAEIAALRRLPHFHLLHLDAPVELRYERVRARQDARTPASLEQFQALEAQEQGATPEAQNLRACAALADVTLENAGDREEFLARADALIAQWLRAAPRPGWDEYFMRIARVAATRSNCVKRKVAALIVKDRRIISTGYNGTPRGVRNCCDGGCPRCNSLAVSGQGLAECLCSHGEENAIVQAAYHGIAIKDAVIYTTFSPCLQCAKMIVNAGLREVVYNAQYPLHEASARLLAEAGVELRQLSLE